MGLENLGQLKVAGALVVVIASFGFLVYDARYVSKINSRVSRKWALQEVGPASTLYSCALALAVLGALVVVALLGGIVVSLLGLSLPSVAVLGLFGGGAVLFLAVLIAGAVAVSTVSGEISSLFYLLENRNYNETDDTRSYVNAYTLYRATPAPNSGNAMGMRGFLGNRSVRANSLTQDTLYCLDRAASSLVERAGGFDFGDWSYAISRLPLTTDLVFATTPSPRPTEEPTRPPSPPSVYVYGYDLYSASGVRLTQELARSASVPICYGIEFDVASWTEAGLKGDVCLVKVARSQKCAPGWDIEKALDLICEQFEECIQDYKDDTREQRQEDLADVGILGVDRSRYYNNWIPGFDNTQFKLSPGTAWIFPAGWNRLSDLRSYKKSQSVSSWNDYVPIGAEFYYGFNLSFLVIGAVGWVFLILGLVLGILGGGGDSKE